MLIPRYSLRLMLVITTACGAFFFVVMLATREHHWAIAVSTAIGGLLATMLLHVLVFVAAWLLASAWSTTRGHPVRSSPFASAGPPEQIIPPPDTE